VSRIGTWGPELGAYAALPFGLALAGYGSIIDQQAWPTGTRTILLALGVGSIIFGLQILRGLPGVRVRPPYAFRAVAVIAPLVIGAAAILAWAPSVAAKLSYLALRDRELPGITIALPDGDEPSGPPRDLPVTISKVAGLDLGASARWQIGTFSDGLAEAIAAGGAKNAGASAPELIADTALPVGDGVPHRSFRVAKKGIEMFITVFACAPRMFGVITAGTGARELSHRILATVRCHPEAEDSLPVPAIVELPADWTRASAGPHELAYNRGDETFGVFAIDLVADGLLEGTMQAAARRLGTEARLGARRDVATSTGTRAVWSGTVIARGAPVSFVLSAWRCPDQPVTLVAHHFPDRDDSSGLELLGHVRCATHSDNP
jgi:hypothetical protein